MTCVDDLNQLIKRVHWNSHSWPEPKNSQCGIIKQKTCLLAGLSGINLWFKDQIYDCVSAERLKLSTNGLKEQICATASPNQCTAIFAESIG